MGDGDPLLQQILLSVQALSLKFSVRAESSLGFANC